MSMYDELLYALERVEDEKLLADADAQLRRWEEARPEFLKGATPYMLHLPEDRTSVFRLCVLGSDGHAIAHMAERLYSNATVFWISNADCYDDSYTGCMDFLIFSERIGEQARSNGDLLNSWGEALAAPAGRLLWKTSFQAPQVSYFYNHCNTNGFAVESFDSNGIAVVRRVSYPSQAQENMQSFNTIYAVCPSSRKSGGAELLHQLVYQINQLSGNAYIAYAETKEQTVFCHPEFIDYVAGHIMREEEIVDAEQNAVVIPEGWTSEVLRFHNASIILWWLSVDNYLVTRKDEADARDFLLQIDRRVKKHLVQSAYARDYLKKNGISEERIVFLGDYINQEYLAHGEESLQVKKKDLVLYNPQKGAEFVAELIKRAPDIQWQAIEGLTTAEAGELMRSAKVYIDFGNFPGKDRIPREAAMSGCVVITGRRGAAGFSEDVPIPEGYRLSEKTNTYDDVIHVIRDGLMQYETKMHDFDGYRDVIRCEKEKFTKDIRSIFFASRQNGSPRFVEEC